MRSLIRPICDHGQTAVSASAMGQLWYVSSALYGITSLLCADSAEEPSDRMNEFHRGCLESALKVCADSLEYFVDSHKKKDGLGGLGCEAVRIADLPKGGAE